LTRQGRDGGGIVLVHDSTADLDEIRPRNQALALPRAIVRELRCRRDRFVRLDAVPQIASALRVSAQWTLVACDGSCLCVPSPELAVTFVSEPSIGPESMIGGVHLAINRWALRSANGFYVSLHPGGEIRADAVRPGEQQGFTVVQIDDHRVTLRTVDGSYLTRGTDQNVLARAAATSPGARDVPSLLPRISSREPLEI
jgi:hypothetical protein